MYAVREVRTGSCLGIAPARSLYCLGIVPARIVKYPGIVPARILKCLGIVTCSPCIPSQDSGQFIIDFYAFYENWAGMPREVR